MKKSLFFALAGALTLTSAWAIDWTTVANLAEGSAVVTSSRHSDAQNIADGNAGTSWQAEPASHSLTNDWALIDLGEKKSFTDIEVVWEASHPATYSIYVSDEAIPYAEVTTDSEPAASYNKIDEDWLSAAEAFATSEIEGESGYTDVITKDGEGRYLLIYANTYNGFAGTYGSRIFEVRVANIAGRDVVTSLKITPEKSVIDEGLEATVTVSAYNVIGGEMDLSNVTDLALVASDAEALTITEGENGQYTVKGNKRGTYTLTATAKAGEEEITATATVVVAYNWTGAENLATGKEISGRYISENDPENPNPVANANDGDADTYYEYNGGWGGGDTWAIVDLGKEYLVEAIGAQYAIGGGRVKIGYAAEIADEDGNLANTDYKWGADLGFTFENLTRESNAITTLEYAAPVKARYVAIVDADNPAGKPQLAEIYVAGQEYASPVATSLSVAFDAAGLFVGETAQVSCIIKDQYGQDFSGAEAPVITVEGADFADGVITATAKGKALVKAALGELVADTAIVVADRADYCMAGATVTSDNEAADGAAAIDGGADPTALGAQFIVSEGESQGEHTHWILAKLVKPYDLDMIVAIWEGACPEDYDIYVGATEEELTKAYSLTDHKEVKTWYDRFCGVEMKDVQYIKIVTTKNASGYGIKLFDLKAYGVCNVESVPTTLKFYATDNNISADETIAFTTEVTDQFGLDLPDAEISYTVSEGAVITDGVFKAAAKGTYTVTATVGDLSEAVVINVVAEESEKLAYTRSVEEGVIEAGDEIQWSQLGASVTIEFENDCDLSLVKLRWEAAAPSDYTVTAEDKDGNKEVVLAVADRAFVGGFNPIDRIVGADTTDEDAGIMPLSEPVRLKKIVKLTITPTAKAHEYNLRLLGVDVYGIDNYVAGINSVGNTADRPVDVYSISGVKVRSQVPAASALSNLPAGIYIIEGQKFMVR